MSYDGDKNIQDWSHCDVCDPSVINGHRCFEHRDSIEINGIRFHGTALAELLNAVTSPDPRRWYRFERKSGHIIVHTCMEDE